MFIYNAYIYTYISPNQFFFILLASLTNYISQPKNIKTVEKPHRTKQRKEASNPLMY